MFQVEAEHILLAALERAQTTGTYLVLASATTDTQEPRMVADMVDAGLLERVEPATDLTASTMDRLRRYALTDRGWERATQLAERLGHSGGRRLLTPSEAAAAAAFDAEDGEEG